MTINMPLWPANAVLSWDGAISELDVLTTWLEEMAAWRQVVGKDVTYRGLPERYLLWEIADSLNDRKMITAAPDERKAVIGWRVQDKVKLYNQFLTRAYNRAWKEDYVVSGALVKTAMNAAVMTRGDLIGNTPLRDFTDIIWPDTHENLLRLLKQTGTVNDHRFQELMFPVGKLWPCQDVYRVTQRFKNWRTRSRDLATCELPVIILGPYDPFELRQHMEKIAAVALKRTIDDFGKPINTITGDLFYERVWPSVKKYISREMGIEWNSDLSAWQRGNPDSVQ